MKEVSQQQQIFARLMGDVHASADVLGSSPLNIDTALEVYRNNLKVAGKNALQITFPVLTQLLSEQGMALLSRGYLLKHPSRSSDLNDLGSEMPRFLQDYEPLQMYAYLSDVAKLEWHVHRSYYAADHMPLQIMDLVMHDTNDWLAAQVEFAPSAFLMCSEMAVASIWQAHQDEGDLSALQNDEVIMQCQHILITRPVWRVEIRVLEVGLYMFLMQLQEGMTFGQAFESVERQGFEFDFTQALPMLLASGIWSHLIFNPAG